MLAENYTVILIIPRHFHHSFSRSLFIPLVDAANKQFKCAFIKRVQAHLLVVSNPSSNGHLCLIVVDALVGGQQSNESHTGLHQSSGKR